MGKILLLILLIANYTFGQVARPKHDPPIVINDYAAVLSYDICTNTFSVDTATFFNPGDTVMIIQMKGAIIDTSNTASFGNILDYKNAGNYEFNYISRKSGNQLTFKNKLTKGYDIPGGIVQLVRVPYFTNAFFVSGLTCKPWDGIKGGVLAVIATNGLNCLDNIDVNGTGFRSGEGYNSVLPSPNCFENNYNYPSASQLAGFKGESIVRLSQNIVKGKGSPAAGGGAGLSHNSGGGGGANGGAGGYGGYQTDTCGSAPFDNRGLGGKNLLYSAAANKIFMGSGGGAGHGDNTGLYPGTPGGGAGGGIIFIITDTLSMNTRQILSTGASGQYCYSQVDCNDGMGGGGGGGSVLLMVNTIIDTLTIQTPGGDGGNVIAPVSPGGRVGPGGGGGGGVFFMNGSSLPAKVAVINNGGSHGVIALDSANPWGATSGTGGLSFFNLVLPFDTVLFKPNIDSIRIKDSLITCNSIGFIGEGFTNTYPIASWYWNFGDGSLAFTQNTSHIYPTENTYTVKLIATDINGCKDSTSTIVNPTIPYVDAGANRSFCSNTPVSVMLNGSGIGVYAWTPASYLNDSTQQYPIATVTSTTTFYLSITNNNCRVKDSVRIIINAIPVLSISKSNDINCYLPYAKLKATGALQYFWSPASTLTSSSVANPIANPPVSTTYFVTGTNDNICYATDSITVAADFSVGNILLPNSFTPNGDGINDCFGIRYYRNVQNLTFIIYNRFGERVFETKNAADCWDGYYKEQPADPGNYIYFLSATTLCGNVMKKGSILLIR